MSITPCHSPFFAARAGFLLVPFWLMSLPLPAQPASKITPAVVTSTAPQTDPVRPSADAVEGISPPTRPGLRVTTTAVRPRIDGKLDDPCWQEAAVIRDFTQV